MFQLFQTIMNFALLYIGVTPQTGRSGGGHESLTGDTVMLPSHCTRPCAEDYHDAGEEATRNTGHSKFDVILFSEPMFLFLQGI